MADEDYLLALELQKEFNREFEDEDKQQKDVVPVERKTSKQAPKRKWSNDLERDLNSTCNLVHPEWETLDPTPDVQSMFLAFDNKFFQSRLKCVTLEWSKRMYSCAGICYSRKCRLGMSITIRLSEPLLKLRPRKDIVETLLHEMIHAYCFVLNIREGNGGHGPYFKKIMYGINKVAGTNITVYHTFHDEVDLYKVHWWRCNGICQHRKPFFGFVKRTSNRAPGPNDFWWQQHTQSCGGTFLKVKEPEPKRKKSIKKTEEIPNNKNDLSTYFSKTNTGSFNKPTNGFDMKNNNNGPKGPIKVNGGGTLLINPKTKIPAQPTKPLISSTPTKSSTNSGKLNNVIGFKDLGDSDSPNQNNRTSPKYEMNGKGYSLNGNSTKFSSSSQNDNGTIDLTKLRDIRSKKYTSPPLQNRISTTEPIVIGSPDTKLIKKRRISTNKKWTNVDDDNNDLIVLDQKPELIYLSSDDENDYIPPITSTKVNIKPTQEERQTQIKKEIIDYTDLLEDDIELIDDEYDDDLLQTTIELGDTSLVDDLFGDDTLLKDFRNENSVIPSCSRYHNDPRNDIVTCPICQEKIKRENFEEHLEGCAGISTKINHRKGNHKKDEEKNKLKEFASVLKKAGYTEIDILKVLNDEFIPLDRTVNSSNSSITNLTSANVAGIVDINHPSGESSMQICPICAKKVSFNEINDHLDSCLQNYQS